MNIKPSLDYEVVLANRACPVHFTLQFEAPVMQKARPQPAAFCIVLDRSGSMDGAPIEKAKQAACVAVRNLRSEDHFAMVTFDDQALVTVPLSQVADGNAVTQSIQAIQSGGSTNLTGGWSLGRDELKKTPAGATRRLLLLSDGHLNHGITEPDMVRQIVASGLELQRIRTSCLGFGEGYNEDIMTAIAQVTSGQFYDADSPEKFPAIFASELDGLQKITIQNLRLRLRPLDFCDGIHPLGQYQAIDRPERSKEYFIGDLVSGENRVVCFAVNALPVPCVQGKPVVSLEGERLLEFEVLYDEISEKEIASRSLSQAVRIQATPDPADVRRRDEVIPYVALQRAGKVMDDLTRLMDQGKLDDSVRSLREAINALKSYGPDAPVTEAVRKLEVALENLMAGEWSVRERKLHKYRSHSYRKMSSSEHWSGSEPPPSFKLRPPLQPPPLPPQTPTQPPGTPGQTPSA